ncbi:hypothetical protein ASPTUDRAFT_30155 [Aspergillus tubingensis CBS 134.48]|uniref:Uncharacterized protein n=1 Tax=Aspergillus tubingensis (strain CBS 134.48) TaxID=767770 RepID=A0A1L9N4E2_ASPTC|nr:hypothetical protein ASPTUDRAFT_30155 [Aspergillus tubingensis CBS 134.48]
MTAFPSPFFLSLLSPILLSSFFPFISYSLLPLSAFLALANLLNCHLFTGIPRRRSFRVSASSDFMNMLLGPITRLAKNMQPTTQASSKREMLCAFHPSFLSFPFLAAIGPSSSFICPPVSMPGAAVMPRGDITKSEYLHSGRPSWPKYKECHPAGKRGELADRETDGGWGLYIQIDYSVSSWSRFLPYGEFSLAVTRMGG